MCGRPGDGLDSAGPGLVPCRPTIPTRFREAAMMNAGPAQIRRLILRLALISLAVEMLLAEG